jgi:hypothetical protein
MAIKNKKDMETHRHIDLTGPDGNAWVLMAYARDLSKQLGLDYYEIHNKMTEGDYENLLEVFDSYFGDYVTLYR